MINADIVRTTNQWKYLRSKIKRRWQALTAEEIQHTGGNTDMLVDLLQAKYGYSRHYAEEEVKQFLRLNTTERRESVDRLMAQTHTLCKEKMHN